MQRRWEQRAVRMPAPFPPPFNRAAQETGVRLLSHTATEFPASPPMEAGDDAEIVRFCPDVLVLPLSLSRYGNIDNLGARDDWPSSGGRRSRGSGASEGVSPPVRRRKPRTENRDKTHAERELALSVVFAGRREGDREEELRSRAGRDALYDREAQAIREVLLDELRMQMVENHVCCVAAAQNAQNEAGDHAALLTFSDGPTVEVFHPVGHFELQLPVATCAQCAATVTACAAQIGCFSAQATASGKGVLLSIKLLKLHTSLAASGVSFSGVSPTFPPQPLPRLTQPLPHSNCSGASVRPPPVRLRRAACDRIPHVPSRHRWAGRRSRGAGREGQPERSQTLLRLSRRCRAAPGGVRVGGCRCRRHLCIARQGW